MNKKLIILVAAGGLVSFGGTFMLGLLTKPVPPAGEQTGGTAIIGEGGELIFPESQISGAGATVAIDDSMKKAMTEKQLRRLIYEVREKIQEYDNKLNSLAVREQRLQVAQDSIKRDIEELENLQVELASTLTSLKEHREQLLKTRVEIAQAEKNNLVSIAATYDKMDATSASKILSNMSKMQSERSKEQSAGIDNIVKILHYMTERTKAKLLAEMSTNEPKLAAVLCQKLKQVIEED